MLSEYERFARVRAEKREARRAERDRKRRARNLARLEQSGMPIPAELLEPEEKMRAPAEDKMFGPGDMGAENKGQDEAPDTAPDIAFASEAAEELAREHNLEAGDFDFEPSGKTGYTTADVRYVLADGS